MEARSGNSNKLKLNTWKKLVGKGWESFPTRATPEEQSVWVRKVHTVQTRER